MQKVGRLSVILRNEASNFQLIRKFGTYFRASCRNIEAVVYLALPYLANATLDN